MESVEEVKRKSKGKESRYGRRYGYEFRLRAVKMRLEKGIPVSLLCKELGVGEQTLWEWLKRYRESGEEGLRDKVLVSGNRQKLPLAVRKKIIEIKRREPFFGVKRISQLLRRVFFLRASPETVRCALRKESLIVPSRKKTLRNPSRPRFFERARPNQMWQSDIFTFRLGGRYAYLIGFMDDYSRYVVGLELYRSQTAEQVLEVYRRGISEYGVPKEVLTDRGRQYTNWRGSTRFERELQKDRVRHIKSQAHHPMTLGKLERFWKTIYEEYLVRAQFGSFEEARERIGQWVQYYNHKRPHQGIEGLCPADRYFEIQAELRKTIEQGISDNVLEMALRGKPREPFYMVGRMEGQSVVLRAEKGKLRLVVDDEQGGGGKQEMVYEVSGGEEKRDCFLRTMEKEEKDGKGREIEDREARGRGQERAEEIGLYGRREVSCGLVGVDREAQSGGGLSGVRDSVGAACPLAGAGDGRDALSVSTTSTGRQNSSPQSPTCGIIGQEDSAGIDQGIGAAAGADSGPTEVWTDEGGFGREKSLSSFRETGNGEQEKTCPAAGDGDSESTQWKHHSPGRGEATGSVTKDLLRMGGAGTEGNGPVVGESGLWKASCDSGRGEGRTLGAGAGVGEEIGVGREDDGGQGDAFGL
jgi:transposase InsO family protein